MTDSSFTFAPRLADIDKVWYLSSTDAHALKGAQGYDEKHLLIHSLL
ncbi:hypothetical protein JGH11_19960 [Dysgonomonas sp. Marseille-P4677]|nr:hypothetical protein [Dysgonomonas sp. Marseille-P4677]